VEILGDHALGEADFLDLTGMCWRSTSMSLTSAILFCRAKVANRRNLQGFAATQCGLQGTLKLLPRQCRVVQGFTPNDLTTADLMSRRTRQQSAFPTIRRTLLIRLTMMRALRQ
jgi:hypothetical protein